MSAIEYFLLFILLAELILISIYCAILMDPFSYWTHRKGYNTPGWQFLVPLPLWLGAIGSVGVFVSVWNYLQNHIHHLALAGYLSLFLLPLIPVAVGTDLVLLILFLMPKRVIRLGGARRSKIPYTALGYGFLLLAGLGLVLPFISTDVSIPNDIRIVFFGFAGSGAMFYLARRSRTPDVEQALEEDPRPPIIYLRSFDQEGIPFVEVSYEDAKKYSEITSYSGNQFTYNLTLEQFLSREINHSIGPFIALGNPIDYLPPEGAYRTYAEDSNWKEYFTTLSDRSIAILMQMGNSDNLGWELTSIHTRGLHRRMFVVTPPPASSVGKYYLLRYLTRMTDRIKGIRPACWDGFAASLEKAGYPRPGYDPGPGAVVTFDEQAKTKTLVRGAKTPAEYIEAICKQLDGLQVMKFT